MVTHTGKEGTMSKPLEVTVETFEEEVLQADKLVLVDFWAEWCAPCRMLAPVLEEIAQELGNKLKVAKVDVDANPTLAARYGIMSIPTLILFKNGKPVEKLVGYMPKARLLDSIKGHMLGTNA